MSRSIAITCLDDLAVVPADQREACKQDYQRWLQQKGATISLVNTDFGRLFGAQVNADLEGLGEVFVWELQGEEVAA